MSHLLASLRRLLPRHRFARSVSILAGGTALAQFLGILAAPLLTRLYSPEDFGILAAFVALQQYRHQAPVGVEWPTTFDPAQWFVLVALLAIVGVISTLRYDAAIPLPGSDREAAHVLGLSFCALGFFALLTSMGVYFWGDSIAGLIKLPELAPYLWLLPIGIILAGLYEVLNYWGIRVRAFPLMARSKLYQVIAQLGVQLGCFSLGPFGLLLGQTIGSGAGAMGFATFLTRQRWALLRQLRAAELWAGAER